MFQTNITQQTNASTPIRPKSVNIVNADETEDSNDYCSNQSLDRQFGFK